MKEGKGDLERFLVASLSSKKRQKARVVISNLRYEDEKSVSQKRDFSSRTRRNDNEIINKRNMNRIIWIAGIFLFLLAACSRQEDEVYMFSFFQGNGEDGLYLAYSYDGLTWEALNNNQSFLTPQVGNDKLIRDPCIVS
ncbi:MAG: hypothetical protein ACP5D9_02365 [Mariniphaga sp.]